MTRLVGVLFALLTAGSACTSTESSITAKPTGATDSSGATASSSPSATTSGPLLQNDFNDGTGSFAVEPSGNILLEYVDGGYRIFIKKPDRPHLMRGFFEGPAVQTLTVAADMTLRGPPKAREVHALACIDGDVGYALIVVPRNHAYAIARADFSESVFDWKVLIEGQSELVGGIGQTQHLSLDCIGGAGEAAMLTASIDGSELDSADDPEGFASFSGMALWVGPSDPNTEVFVDNVLASEP
jgi:ABC-type transport system substrate-binding protein